MRRRDDSGFTVVELMITMMLAAIVSAAISGILVSQQNAERDVSRFTENSEEVRQALVEIARDMRSAEPLMGVGTAPEMAWQLDLKMYDTITSQTPHHVRWRVATQANGTKELVREELDATDAVTATTYRMKNVVNDDPTQPLFTYFPAGFSDGATPVAPYNLNSVGVQPWDVAYCTVRIRIDLRGLPKGGRKPVRLITEVQLRNKLPGADECQGTT